MSHSAKTIQEFGAVNILGDARLRTGSTSEAQITIVPAPSAMADAAATLTIAQVKSGLLTMTPSAARILTLPTATSMVTYLKNIGDSADLTIINLGADTMHITLAAGTGGSVVGLAVVRDSDPTAASASGSGTFRIRVTGVTSPAYVAYRLH